MNSQILESPRDKNHINEILRKFRTSPDLSETFSWTIFSWSDRQHKITVDAQYGIMQKPFDLSIRDYIRLTNAEPNKFHLGSPVLGSTSKKWMIPGGVGLVDARGNYLGAVTIGFEIESLTKILRKSVEPAQIEFELLNDSNSSILHSVNSGFGASKNVRKISNATIDEMLSKLKASDLNSIVDIKLLGDRHGFLARKVRDYPFIFLVKYDQQLIEDNLYESLKGQNLQLFSILFGLSLLLILVYREGEQKQKIILLRRAADQANVAKSEFLSQTAHELKNFIFGILGSAEIIKIDLLQRAERLKKSAKEDGVEEITTDLEFISEIISSSNELSEFVNDIIDLNQAETGEFKINRSAAATDVRKIIQQSVRLLSRRAGSENIKILTQIDADLEGLSNLDPRRIKQIVVNLISNAIKYSVNGTEIKVIAKNISSSDQKRIEILIKDHGFGMSEEEVKIAMQKYQTIANENTGKVDSLGLGLPIVKYLVEKQGGILEIKSQKGVGTEVKIILVG